MANLTITIDDELLKRARIRAAEQGTSVNAVVREEITRFAGEASGSKPIDQFLAFARANTASSGDAGRNWTREELHLERFNRS